MEHQVIMITDVKTGTVRGYCNNIKEVKAYADSIGYRFLEDERVTQLLPPPFAPMRNDDGELMAQTKKYPLKLTYLRAL